MPLDFQSQCSYKEVMFIFFIFVAYDIFVGPLLMRKFVFSLPFLSIPELERLTSALQSSQQASAAS